MKVNIRKYSDNRKINIEIERFDTWNMDHTLALIIVPMLRQLKDTMLGVPQDFAGDGENVDVDGWNFVLNRMIWSFDQIAKDDESDFWDGDNLNNDAYLAYHSCIQDGIDLFAKYYRNLWD